MESPGWDMGDRRLKQTGFWPTTTACVVGDFRDFSLGSADRSALVIRSRWAKDRRLGVAKWAWSTGRGVGKNSAGGRVTRRRTCATCVEKWRAGRGRGRRRRDGRGPGPRAHAGAPLPTRVAGAGRAGACECGFGRGGIVARVVARFGHWAGRRRVVWRRR